METRIEGYPDYAVTRAGEVISYRRGRVKTLKPSPDGGGYLMVVLTADTGSARPKARMQKVHRLVARTYIPNPRGLPQIDHIDGDKLNNHASNLRWVTAKANIRAYHGLEGLDDHEMAADYLMGATSAEVAAKHGTTMRTVLDAVRGLGFRARPKGRRPRRERWRHVKSRV